MQGVTYLVAAYAIAWVGLFVYLAFLSMRIRGVRTELAAATELVREQQERGRSQASSTWDAEKSSTTYKQQNEER
jgi:CcmD family protein